MSTSSRRKKTALTTTAIRGTARTPSTEGESKKTVLSYSNKCKGQVAFVRSRTGGLFLDPICTDPAEVQLAVGASTTFARVQGEPATSVLGAFVQKPARAAAGTRQPVECGFGGGSGKALFDLGNSPWLTPAPGYVGTMVWQGLESRRTTDRPVAAQVLA
jgi:hypothetical protein